MQYFPFLFALLTQFFLQIARARPLFSIHENIAQMIYMAQSLCHDMKCYDLPCEISSLR